jgi:hypothetical protein
MNCPVIAGAILLAQLTLPSNGPTVKISLALSDNEYCFTESIPATYAIENLSSTTVLLPKDVVESPRGNPKFEIIQESTGRPVHTMRRFFPPHPPHLVVPFDLCVALEPGGKHSCHIDIGKIYYPSHDVGGARLDKAGRYTVTFLYENTLLDGRGSTYTVLRGAHRSNTESFVLRPPNEKESILFLRDLGSTNPERLQKSLYALSMARDERVLPRLYELLSTGPLQLQRFACAGLSYFGQKPKVLARLLHKASSDHTDIGRIYALDAVEEVGNPVCIPTLVNLCKEVEKHPKAATVAARMLLMTFESAEHLDTIEDVMQRRFGARGNSTWKAKIRELRRKAPRDKDN